jgi:hypothetical protein
VPANRAPARKPAPRATARTDEVKLEIDGQSAKCTRLSKILYPETRVRKADVIDNYIRVAPFILPHLKNLTRRPSNVHNRHADRYLK